MNKKDIPAIYSTAFWCLFVVLLIFLALLRNRCYSFHRTNMLCKLHYTLPSQREFGPPVQVFKQLSRGKTIILKKADQKNNIRHDEQRK